MRGPRPGPLDDWDVGRQTVQLGYDAENRLVSVSGTNLSAQFTYNGDGQKVKSVINGETVYLVNGYYEKKGSEITKYYFAGASRVAMRKYTIPQSMSVEYFLGDHLGSTSITTDNTGAKISEMRYSPWGEVRSHWVDSNLSTTPSYKLPVYTFTGQRSYMDDPSTTAVEGFGLLDYNARMYDPALGRFTSADDIITNGLQSYDRYNYVNNSPTVYTDPSGHQAWQGDGGDYPSCAQEPKKGAVTAMQKSIEGKPDKHMFVYTVASIGVQNPVYIRGSLYPVLRPYWPFGDPARYSGEGLAKVSDAQMESPWGEVINYGVGQTNGIGLGLRIPGSMYPDQNDPQVANLAMLTRINAVLDKCNGACNPTNTFLAAALGGDSFVPNSLKDLRNGGVYGKPHENGIFNWENYFANPDTGEHDLKVLQQFVNNVVYLQSQGKSIPKGIDWGYVCSLLKEKE